MENYRNINIIGINRLNPHGMSVPFDTYEQALHVENEYSKYYKSLNGTWNFFYAKNKYEIPSNHYNEDFDASTWDSTPVPSNWQMNGYDIPNYLNVLYPYPLDPPNIPDSNPIGIYRTHFFVPDNFKKRKTIIHFGGVNSAFTLYINGIEIGYSQCSHMPAEFDITNYINIGSNVISVEVYKWNVTSYLEDQDFFRHSGITRDVFIYSKAISCFSDIYYNVTLDNNYIDGILDIECDYDYNNYTALLTIYDDTKTEIFKKQLPNSNKASYILTSPKKWTSETPNIYTAIMVLMDKYNNIIDIRSTRIGFKKIEIKDEIFLVNNQPIKIKGVNHHDTHPTLGHAISKQSMLDDVISMKQHNINSVRTSHYPPDEYFLTLCDIYGLYVIDEADLETHGFGYDNHAYDISDKSEWEPHFRDRAKRMVIRDRSHPSIIMWSLGNETRYGKNHLAMIDEIKKLNTLLPIHFEQAHKEKSVDVISVMYTDVEDIIKEAKDTSDKRPYFMCEYAHSMGNAPGNLKEYWDTFYKYPKLMGGCVWEWVDHAVLTKDTNNVSFYAYGGDFNDVPNDGNFCMDGLNFPNRTPHTSLKQLKKILEPAKIIKSDLHSFVIKNTNSFQSLDYLNCNLEHIQNGIIIEKANLKINSILPGIQKEFTIPFIINPKFETCINIYFTLESDILYAKKDYLVCSSQIVFEKINNTFIENIHSSTSISIIDKNRYISFNGQEFSITFDRLTGYISSWISHDTKLINEGFKGNFYRAATDNDKANQKNKWLDEHLNDLQSRLESFEYIINKENVVIKANNIYSGKSIKPIYKIEFTYTIYNSGELNIKSHFIPLRKITYIPRIGYNFSTPILNGQITWYGLGPDETYVDKKEYAMLGIHTNNIEDMFEKYEYPQENGNKMDVRWVSFKDDNNKGIIIIADNKINVSSYYYDINDIDKATHIKQLHKKNQLLINIDYMQTGLGNNSCGAETLEQYQLYPIELTFDTLYVPFDGNLQNEHKLYNKYKKIL